MTNEQLLEGLEFLYGGPSEDIWAYEAKIIKSRSIHFCRSLYHKEDITIPAGSLCAVESGVISGEGWVSCYTCLSCCEEGYKEISK